MSIMLNKSPFGSASHFANMGIGNTSNPRRLKSQSRQFFSTSWPLLHGNMGPTLARCHNKWPWRPQTKKSNRNFTVTGMSMSCLDRARTANLDKFWVPKAYFESITDSQLKHPPWRCSSWMVTLDSIIHPYWLSIWSLHELNVCNSIAAEQTLPVRFARPIFHGHSHCAHAFVLFVWYSARFSDTINSGLLPEWKEIGFTLCPVDCKATAENIVSQCVAMRTSQSIDWVDSSNCKNSGALSTQNAMSMCKSFSRHKCLFTSWTPA